MVYREKNGQNGRQQLSLHMKLHTPVMIFLKNTHTADDNNVILRTKLPMVHLDWTWTGVQLSPGGLVYAAVPNDLLSTVISPTAEENCHLWFGHFPLSPCLKALLTRFSRRLQQAIESNLQEWSEFGDMYTGLGGECVFSDWPESPHTAHINTSTLCLRYVHAPTPQHTTHCYRLHNVGAQSCWDWDIPMYTKGSCCRGDEQ